MFEKEWHIGDDAWALGICPFLREKIQDTAKLWRTELIKLPVLPKRRPSLSYRPTEYVRRAAGIRERQARGPRSLSAASPTAPLIERKILAIILMNVTFVRSFPARENNPFLRPPKREEGGGEVEGEGDGRMVSLVRVVCWNGRAIEH